jgi:hypothetical protein
MEELYKWNLVKNKNLAQFLLIIFLAAMINIYYCQF